MILVYIPLQGYLGAGVSEAFQVCAGVDAWLLDGIVGYANHHLLLSGLRNLEVVAGDHGDCVGSGFLVVEVEGVYSPNLAAAGVYTEY